MNIYNITFGFRANQIGEHCHTEIAHGISWQGFLVKSIHWKVWSHCLVSSHLPHRFIASFTYFFPPETWHPIQSQNSRIFHPLFGQCLWTLFFLEQRLCTIHHPSPTHRDFSANNITTIKYTGIEDMKSLAYLFVSERISGKNVLELFTVLVFCDRYMNDNFLDSIVSMKSLYSLSSCSCTHPDRRLNGNCLDCDAAESLIWGSTNVSCANDTQGGDRCDNGLHQPFSANI